MNINIGLVPQIQSSFHKLWVPEILPRPPNSHYLWQLEAPNFEYESTNSIHGASLVAQRWRVCLQCRRLRFNPWVRKITLEEGKSTHSSILAWKIPWTEKSDRLQSIGSQRIRLSVQKHSSLTVFFISWAFVSRLFLKHFSWIYFHS